MVLSVCVSVWVCETHVLHLCLYPCQPGAKGLLGQQKAVPVVGGVPTLGHFNVK